MHRLEKCFSSSFLNKDDKTLTCHKDVEKHIVTPDMLDVTDCPFNTGNICKVKIVLPPKNVSVGFVLKSDLVTGLPIIQSTVYNSVAYRHLKPGQRSNMYLISIDGQDQLSAQAAALFIKDVQAQNHQFMTIEIVKRDNIDTSTSLVSHRSIFDQVPALIPTNPVIASAGHQTPSTLSEFVTSASKPTTPKLFFDALKSTYRDNQKATAWKHFCSNKKIVAFSKLFRRVELPIETKVFRYLLVLEIKPTDVPGIWQLKVRHAIVGTPQQQYVDYDDSYAPTIDSTTVRIQICFTCHCNYTLGIIDVKNAFQNTIAPIKSRLYCTLPPTYLEWLTRLFKESFDSNEKYVMQMLNSCQRTKDASCLFYKSLRKAMEGYGCIR